MKAQLLKLDISKAKVRLKWQPNWGLNTALRSIIEWHQAWMAGDDMENITLTQINKYELTVWSEA